MEDYRRLGLLTDFYEYSMANGYFQVGRGDRLAYFDVYFRKVPEDGGYAIYAGLEQIIKIIQDLKFSEDDIDFIRRSGDFSEDFLDYLRNFKFECDIWSFKEGSVIYPNEPLMIIRGPIIQVQLLETFILTSINHQSLIATKASRMVNAANGKAIVEFGSRRAQGYSAAIFGARAAYIGGVIGTSNTLAGKEFGIPVYGTMAHSWVQFFDSEYEAFKAYAEVYPDKCNLLIDTYDTIHSGIKNAIRVFDEFVVAKGFRPTGVRIDSGDIAYLSKLVRKELDEAGYEDVPIMASNSIDEHIIKSLYRQEARVDSFGVGERLITSKSEPVFGAVYKLVAQEEDGKILPKIKISENVEKITTPGFKQVYRFFDKNDGRSMADLVTLHHEDYRGRDEVEIFHPTYTWKKRLLKNFRAQAMLERIYDKGRLVYQLPELEEIREYSLNSVEDLWDEQKRLEYPHSYIVDLSLELWELKNKLLNKRR